jgi:hypothetical protein
MLVTDGPFSGAALGSSSAIVPILPIMASLKIPSSCLPDISTMWVERFFLLLGFLRPMYDAHRQAFFQSCFGDGDSLVRGTYGVKKNDQASLTND